MHACSLGHADICKALLAAGADVALRDSAGLSALTHAVIAGEAASVDALLEAGAAADEHTSTGAPLLLHALASGQDAIAEKLLDAGASPDAATDLPADAPAGASAPPLLLAAQAGSTKLIRLLLEKGASPAAASSTGVTPLHVVAASGSLSSVKAILEAAATAPAGVSGQVINAKTENGTVALHTAARQAHSRVVSELLGASAEVDIADIHGLTPLAAAFEGLQAVAKYVENALSEVSKSTDRKLANEMLARAAGPHIQVMDALLKAGASPSISDKEGGSHDATAIVNTYKAMAKRSGVDSATAKDEL